MQFSGDSALNSYLTGDRVLAAEVLIDWDRDGFLSPYSDMSTLYEVITVERDLTGDIPDEVNLIEGFSVAKLSLRLSGTRDEDSLSIADLVSPWNKNSPYYGKNFFGCGIIYRILVPLSGEVRKIDQFVGVIREVNLTEEGRVDVEALDMMDSLSRAVTMRPIAVDYIYLIFSAITSGRQNFNLSWAIDQVLRQCGLYQSPAAVLTSGTIEGYFCLTLSGAWWPEAASSPNYVSLSDAVIPPDDLYIPGKYGYAANGTVRGRGKYTYTVDPHPTWVKGETHQLGAWVYGPVACINSEICIGKVTLTGDHELAGLTDFQFYLSAAGIVRLQLRQFTGQAYSVTFTGPTISVVDWHYIGVGVLWKLDGTIQVTFNVDGAITTNSNATNFLGPTFAGSYSTVTVESNMPIQHFQWFKEKSATLTWPKDLPVTSFGVSPQTEITWATTWLTQIPDVFLTKGLDVLKEMLSAELGVMFSTESGKIRFLSRDTVNNSRTSANTFTLTEDEIKSTAIHSRVDSYRNLVIASSSLWVLIPQTFFKSDKKERFDTPALSVTRFYVEIDSVYRVTSSIPPFTSPWNSNVSSGFYVVRISDNTVPSGVIVVVTVVHQRLLAIDVINPNNFEVRLADASGNPALNLAGYGLYEFSSITNSYQDDGSIAEFGSQQIYMSGSPWRTRSTSQQAIANSILEDIALPIPVIDPVEVRGDPRVQLNDICIYDTRRMGKIVSAVIGIKRTLAKEEPLIDVYSLRALHPPGFWLLGEPGYSELGDTTTLA